MQRQFEELADAPNGRGESHDSNGSSHGLSQQRLRVLEEIFLDFDFVAA